MNTLSDLAAAGLWPAVPITGYLLCVRPLRRYAAAALPPIARAGFIVVAGLVAWSPVLLGTAMLGIYTPTGVGVGGWAVTLGGLAFILSTRRSMAATGAPPNADLRRRAEKSSRPNARPGARQQTAPHRRATHPPAPGNTEPDGHAWNRLLWAGLFLAAMLYLAFPGESIYGGRDEGIYANFGVYLAQHGRLGIPYPWPEEATSIFSGRWIGYPGLYQTAGTMTLQFGDLLPVWLAQAYATGGPAALFRLNACFALLSAAVFFGLCRRLLPAPYAVLTTLFLAFAPPQLWIARMTLSEVFTQLLIWSGFLVLHMAIERQHRAPARWAGLCLGLATLVRIDSLLLAPLLMIGHAAVRIISGDDRGADDPAGTAARRAWRSPWAAFYQTAIPTWILTYGYYRVFDAPYLLERSYITQLGTALFAAMLALGCTHPAVGRRLRPLLSARPVLLTAGAAWVGAAVWAYWIRPAAPIAAQLRYHWPGFYFDPGRDYSRDSLVNMGRYLSPPVVWLAIGGWFAAVWDAVRSRLHVPLVPFLVAIAGTSVVHLTYPIGEDHIWVVRRFVPVTIPGMVLCAALGTRWVVDRLPVLGARVAAGAVAAGLVAFLGYADRFLVTLAEDRGYYEQIAKLAAMVPSDEVILARGQTEWITPLYVSFGRRAVPINLDPGTKGRAVLREWVARQAAQQRRTLLLVENPVDLTEYAGRQLGSVVITRTYSEPTMSPLPQKTVSKARTIRLYELAGFSQP